MAIMREFLDFVSVSELLDGEHELRIPDFQRPYSWTPKIAAQLFTDVRYALNAPTDQPYILGTVILLNRPTETHFEVVDGQQRLLTLRLLRAALRGEILPQLGSGTSPIHLVSQELNRRVADLVDEDQRGRYREFLDQRTKVLRIVTDNEDEAFQFFDSQNFRGKALRPHDLLKAYHLREMHDASSSVKRAVVDQWELADENDLDKLFSTYLVRIHRWSRNLPAHGFTVEDIGLFKGVGRSDRTPGADYHRAAKIVLPGIQEWADPSPDAPRLRDLNRARHQLDAPVVAGKSFFEFASFMLEESGRLAATLFEGHAGDTVHAPDLSKFRDDQRFRFCRELLVAAALYYTNKYSESELSRVRHHLFRWAYALRLGYERLGWKSVDNYALGRETNLSDKNDMNLFSIIRDCLDPGGVPLENVQAPETSRSGHADDETLAGLLKSGNF
jgi:hypothetical protein